jgi:hypothetical protein
MFLYCTCHNIHVQYSAVQCSAVQCSAVQCSAVQCSAVQCSAVQFSAVQCSAETYITIDLNNIIIIYVSVLYMSQHTETYIIIFFKQYNNICFCIAVHVTTYAFYKSSF